MKKARVLLLTALMTAVCFSSCAYSAEKASSRGRDAESAFSSASPGFSSDRQSYPDSDGDSSADSAGQSDIDSNSDSVGQSDSDSDSASHASDGGASSDSQVSQSSSEEDNSSAEEKHNVLVYLISICPVSAEERRITLSQDSGEELDTGEAVSRIFMRDTARALENRILTENAELTKRPVYVFRGWAYDKEGKQPFEGVLPPTDELYLYAVWERSGEYCKIVVYRSEEKEAPESYYAVKGSEFTFAAEAKIKAPLEAFYGKQNRTVDALTDKNGDVFEKGRLFSDDVELYPRLSAAQRQAQLKKE